MTHFVEGRINRSKIYKEYKNKIIILHGIIMKKYVF